MKTKNFNGKALYNPSGKAGEYSQWACNFYVGCSNGCEYCYCKKGILSPIMGMDKPQLKKCFYDEDNALAIFQREVRANQSELQKHGLFFSFTTDPMLPETKELTLSAVEICYFNYIPSKILTKCAEWVDDFLKTGYKRAADEIAFGFTLTGHDELEKGASTNQERIEAMRKLHEAGFKTWASIEPIIDFESSCKVISESYRFCDLYKIGLMSGKTYDKKSIINFISDTWRFLHSHSYIYFKDSLLKQAGIDRESLPLNCVGRDFNLFQT